MAFIRSWQVSIWELFTHWSIVLKVFKRVLLGSDCLSPAPAFYRICIKLIKWLNKRCKDMLLQINTCRVWCHLYTSLYSTLAKVLRRKAPGTCNTNPIKGFYQLAVGRSIALAEVRSTKQPGYFGSEIIVAIMCLPQEDDAAALE